MKKQSDGIRFRNWMSRVTRNAILKALSRGPRDPAAGGSQILDVLGAVPSADNGTDELIELEYRREVYVRAAARVREDVQEVTWLAFEATVLQAVSIEAAAKRLGVSTGSVYAARSRVMRRLKAAVVEREQSELGTMEPEERDEPTD